MKETIQRILAAIAFVLISIMSLVLALSFVFALLIGVAIFFIVSRFRGRSFSAKQFWQEHSARARSTTQNFKTRYRSKYANHSGYFTRPAEADVTDVEFREIK